MGKKYIVELGRCERLYKAYINGIGKPELAWLSPEIDLTPYTEPDLEQVRKEEYEHGYYIGLSDAWEAAKKIVTMPDREFINSNILDLDPGESIFTKYTASEAIEKIRQYEQEKEEQIQVGDEVIATSGKAVILSINDDKDKARYIYHDSTLGFDKICNLSKTGRHFTEIDTVIEKMRGDQE